MKPKTALCIGLCLLFLGLIGWQNTPRGSSGTPLLLLPNLRKVNIYQRHVAQWIGRLSEIDGQLSVLFSSTPQDLMQSSQDAESLHRSLEQLYREVDQKDPPPSLQGLKETLLKTTISYLEAINHWLAFLSSGGSEDQEQARTCLAEAHSLFLELSRSPWIQE